MGKTTPVLFAMTLFLAACTPPTPERGQNADVSNGIFSNRPQIQDRVLLLIKLKEQPLLSKLGDGKVDAALAQAIAGEQAKLINDLAALSPDIQVLFKYRLVLNGVAVVAPVAVTEKIRALANVAYAENAGNFSRPKTFASPATTVANALREHNSVKFIGGEVAHARGLRGQGTRVGIIDTGIDYTHAMFGGAGTEEAYKSIDPSRPNAAFPSAKVVGGYDFAGTEYDSASGDARARIPTPDANPLDEGGHGTHVAGTVAGRGDLVNTYDGVAPDALLYAIKVFGKNGSTGDATVIAALEYAADPNADADLADKLDVVNLSLGGEYGDPHLLYTEATRNLSRAGTVVVASAGNSGDTGYIVGAPSVAEDAISVAASVDDMEHNWKFRAVKFTLPDGEEIAVEGIEASIAKPIAEAGDVQGPLVYAGLADKDFDEALASALKGKIAFIDRGIVTFAEKIKRAADAGALGVVVANNAPGEPMAMGGDGKFDLPAIMIAKDLADRLKAARADGDVVIRFNTDLKIEKPFLIDSITGFSSKGPRSMDALLKPEISAPGAQVISARMGGGAQGVPMSGTSMAAPHMAGVMALMKQKFPAMTSDELKSLVMGSAKPIRANGKDLYPLSRQGAGRVQILEALDSVLVSSPQAISLGEVTIESRKVLERRITVKNIAAETAAVTLTFDSRALRIAGPASFTLAAGESKALSYRFTVDASKLAAGELEAEGTLLFTSKTGDGERVLRVPALAVANKIARAKAEKLAVRSTSEADAQGAAVDLTLSNAGVNAGAAIPFNLIGLDGRKEDPSLDPFRSRACDLAAAGYRVIKRDGAAVLQFAAKLHEPVTTWDQCEVSVLIDADGDLIADQELVGLREDHLKGLTKTTFASVLLDAGKTRALRKQFELDTMARREGAKEDYTAAIVSLDAMTAIPHSTIAIVEVPVAALKIRPSGELSVRLATSYQEGSAVLPDDFLEKDPKSWRALSVADLGAGFVDLPEKIELSGGETKTVSFTKGAGGESLLLLYPSNKPVVGGLSADEQSEIVRPVFEIE